MARIKEISFRYNRISFDADRSNIKRNVHCSGNASKKIVASFKSLNECFTFLFTNTHSIIGLTWFNLFVLKFISSQKKEISQSEFSNESMDITDR